MTISIIILFFFIGLLMGSFLNVVISRMQTLETILGRSFCRHCRRKIRWYDNVPLVSYIILRRRCRDCGEVISWQYPLVEFASGLLFALVVAQFLDPSRVETWMMTVIALIAVSVGVVIFVYDLKHMEIPMLPLWSAIVLTILGYLIVDWQEVRAVSVSTLFSLNLYSGMVAGIGAFLFFFLLVAFSKEQWMGLGDAYVALWIGLLLGWPGIFAALLLAFLLGSVVSIALLLTSKAGLKTRVPFAPFMLIGAGVIFFAEPFIAEWLGFFLF